MTYVMGLDAAKTRPATEAERAEMAALLNEGMDAGLCGFSIQRLGRNSAQADFDGSPMVTDTMCDEDILNLARVLRARDEGFIEITQATGHIKEDLAFVEKLAGDRAASDSVPGDHGQPPQPRDPSQAVSTGCRMRAPRVCRSSARAARFAAASPSRSSIGTSTTSRLRGVDMHDRHQGRENREDEGSRDPRGGQERTRDARAGQATPGHRRAAASKLIVQWVENKPELEKYVGKSLGQIGEEEGQASG